MLGPPLALYWRQGRPRGRHRSDRGTAMAYGLFADAVGIGW